MRVSLCRRRLLARASMLLVPLALSACGALQPQADRVHRVTFVSPIGSTPVVDVIKARLAELGFVEGRNLVFQAHFGGGDSERFQGQVAQAVKNSDVIMTGTGIGTLAVMKATSTVPIVFAGVFEPRGAGIVTDPDRPGGNVTGAAMDLRESIHTQWVALLREASPQVRHIAVLTNQGPLRESHVQQITAAARAANVRADIIDAGSGAALDKAFASIAQSGAGGMIVLPDPFFTPNREKLARFAAERRLPAMYFFKSFAEAGGLMSYGGSQEESYRKGAEYVARILRGEKPGDIPVYHPARAELIINAKTAKGMGLMIPPAMLRRADKVIE